MNKICCIFINHNIDLYKEVFDRMSNSVDYIDFYNYNPDWGIIQEVFGDMMFKDRTPFAGVFSGNVFFAVYYFKITHPEYDYYFICENDVYFTGDYKVLFDRLTENIYDFDAILEKPIYRVKGWIWVEDEIDYKLLDGYNNKNYYHSLYTFYCLSNNLVEHIMQRYRDGYYGHHELVMSCVLQNYGGKYDYVNDHVFFKNTVFPHKIYKRYFKLKNALLHPVKQALPSYE